MRVFIDDFSFFLFVTIRNRTVTVESKTGAVALVSRWLLTKAFAFVASVRFGLALFPVRRVGQWRGPGFE
jgi:hypothetical protein